MPPLDPRLAKAGSVFPPVEMQPMGSSVRPHDEDDKSLRSESESTTSGSDAKLDSGSADTVPSVDNTPEVLNKALSGLSSRWKNWWVRGILTLAMISFFFLIIYLGPMVLMMI
eukprot:g47068.t1